MKASCLLHVHVGAAIADLSAAGVVIHVHAESSLDFHTHRTTAGLLIKRVHYGWTYTNKDWFPTLKFFYMSHEISRRIFR